MTLSKILHQAASEYSTFAMVAKAKGKLKEAKEYFQKAFELEQEAVLKLDKETYKDDILFPFIIKRSAAALAYKAGFYAKADQLVVQVLKENPPAFIVKELKEITDLVKSARKAQGTPTPFQINGKLTGANTTKHEIEVEDAQNRQHYAIFVPTDEIKAIVKTFFSEWVQVQAIADPNGALTLKKIGLKV